MDNSFAITDTDEFTEAGITCSGSISVAGTVSGDNISGPVSGSVTCNGIPIDISGDLRATRSTTATLTNVIPSPASGMLRRVGRSLDL